VLRTANFAEGVKDPDLEKLTYRYSKPSAANPGSTVMGIKRRRPVRLDREHHAIAIPESRRESE